MNKTGDGTRGDWRVRLVNWAVGLTGAAVFLIVSGGRPARADLTHRYTFNDGSADDSVSNADGVVLGNAFVDGDGILRLPGGSDDYVSLDGPAINTSSYTDVTFETWFTSDQLLTWQRVFDFGDRTVPAAQQGYIYYTPQGGNGGGLGVYATFGQRTEAPHATLQTDHLYHLAMVIDDNANGGSDLLSVYLDGALQTAVGHDKSLSNVGDTFAYLGKSLVAVDPNFNGSIDEFRIYDHAMDLGEVQSSFAAGPTPPVALRLEVNTVTGSVAIVAEQPASIAFDYYSITSAGGALDPTGWRSLDDQDLDSMGSGAGQSWDEAPTSDSSRLIELFLLGGSTLADGARLGLGHAFDPAVFGQGSDGDLAFRFSRVRSPLLQVGEVVYVTPDPLDGDYNQNGVVDAADYTVWRDTLGSDTDLRADGDADGVIDEGDYLVWKWTFGNTAGAGSTAAHVSAVPEPAIAATLFLALLGSAVMFGRWRR